MTQNEQPKRSWFTKRLAILLSVLVLLIGFQVADRILNPGPEEVALTEVLAFIEDGEVKEAVVIDGTRTVELTLKNDDVVTSGYPVFFGTELVEKLSDADVKVEATPVTNGNVFVNIFISLIPFLLILGFLVFYMRGKGGLGIGKLGKGRGVPVEVPETRFVDVAGVDEVVAELKEVTEFLQQPERFTASGARVPRGFLLAGPPGTGKTLLARAVAGEAGVPFFALSGSDFVETFVGVGAGRMRDLFEKAKAAGSAIIFIDEIDAVGKARSSGIQTGANEERENTLNALLTEMDGFSQTSGIIILAATNRSDILDPALTRPGRFDRKIIVPAPDKNGREQIFKLHAKGLKLADDVDFRGLAKRTPGLTGADIAGLVNEAALGAARNGEVIASQKDFENALQTTVLGRERRSAIISPRDQEITAWHEAGHTVAALLQKDAYDPVQVTIVPRGPAGGVTWMGGSEHDFMTRSQAYAQLVVSMAGRAAEEVLLGGDFTQGAQGDLSSATSLATDMIARYGMTESMLISLGEDRMTAGDLTRVNEEVSVLLFNALKEARTLLAENSELIEIIAKQLIIVETLHLEDLRKIEQEVLAASGGTSLIKE